MTQSQLRIDVRRNGDGRIELRFYTAAAENVTATVICTPEDAANLAQQIVDSLQPAQEPPEGETP